MKSFEWKICKTCYITNGESPRFLSASCTDKNVKAHSSKMGLLLLFRVFSSFLFLVLSHSSILFSRFSASFLTLIFEGPIDYTQWSANAYKCSVRQKIRPLLEKIGFWNSIILKNECSKVLVGIWNPSKFLQDIFNHSVIFFMMKSTRLKRKI